LRGLRLSEGRGGKREGDKRGRERKGGEGRVREERGEEAFLVMWPRKLSALNPPLVANQPPPPIMTFLARE